MDVLVTGGAGFLGSHLCEKLLSQGHRILCLDNLTTGSLDNVAHLQANENFTFLEGDICDALDVSVDAIYNLACPASPIHYQGDPIQTLKVNTTGMFELLDLARHNQALILQASTSEVYGDPQVHPQTEDYWGHVNPNGPRACYDEGKRVAEILCLEYQRKFGISVKIPRIFNTYGPRMHPDDGRVVSNFIVQALQGLPLTIYGDGSQTRSFCYVDDMVDGLIRLMHSDVSGPLNLGNPEEYSVKDLAKRVLDMTGTQVQLDYQPLPIDDPQQRRPSIEAARSKLGWAPSTPLHHGLLKTVAYFRERLQVSAISPQ